MSPGARWIAGIVGLLVANAVAAAVLIGAAGSDTARRVVPDYYQRAVAWDQTMAADAASAQLGWQVTATAAARLVEVTVRDRGGAPVTGATIVVQLHPRGHADERAELTLTAGAAGSYRGVVPGRRHGLHDLAVAVTRGADRWGGARLVELTAGPVP